MKIEFKMDGGPAYFPGLSKPLLIDTDALSEAQDKEELESLVQSANFFGAPSAVATSAPGRPDHRQYTITIENAGEKRTVQLTDREGDPQLRDLINYLRAKARKSLSAS